MKKRRRVALFGGTFDPVHQGHLSIARWAHEQADLDEVVFLPCQQSPHKSSASLASAAQRYEMLCMAMTEPWMRVDNYELQSPAPSYSVDTVRHFQNIIPGVDWFWIMGADQWQALPKWREPEYLAEHLTFLVFSRDAAVEPREGYRHLLLHGHHPASATELRNPSGPHYLDRNWICPAVLEYLQKQNLYEAFP